jgi:DNA-binding beta-propeller fold protein YncE
VRAVRAMLLAGALLAALWLAPAAGAAGVASGALTQPGGDSACIGEEESKVSECTQAVPYGLNFAYEVQVSPDGSHAYSVSVNGDVIEYSRDLADGALSVIGCISSNPSSAGLCASEHAELEVEAVAAPAGIAISPDGKDAYVIGQTNSTVAEFEIESSGLLRKIGCITHEATFSECEAGGATGTTNAKGLGTPYGIAVSPEGENVYVTGFAEEAVAEFKRNGETGVLTQLAAPNECVGDASSACGTKTIGLKEDIGIAVSGEGRDVYVGAGTKGAEGDVAVLARGVEGALAPPSEEKERCISEAVSGCATGAHIDGIEDLIVSPDGENVYASSAHDNAVIELKRTETGALEELGSGNDCISTEALAECKQVKGVGRALGLAISPGGEDVYASSESEATVASFSRERETGALAQLATPCVTERASGCEAAELDERAGLRYPRRLTVSPDGTNVYVASQEGHAIAELDRTVTPTVSRIDVSYGSTEGGTKVYIKGSGFARAEGMPLEVEFGGAPAAKAEVQSATSIVAESPEHAEGAAAVVVENAAGASAQSASATFTYTDKPLVAGVSPDAGREDGGSEVTIAGSGLASARNVYFGGVAAASFTVTSPETIVATTPHHREGTLDVTVETASGTSATGSADEFTYVHGTLASQTGLDLAGYCVGLGDNGVVLERDSVSGPGYAYENWACEAPGGAETLIANAGPAPSMANACEAANPGVTSFAYPSEVDNAYTWGCSEIEPSTIDEEESSEAGKDETAAKNEPATAKTAAVTARTSTGSTSSVAPPVLAVSGNVAPVSGTVLVKLPGGGAFVALSTLRQIPFGSVINATDGRVSVTIATPSGATQTGEFFAGEFILTQGRDGMVVAALAGGDFAVCPTARERSHIARASGASALRASGASAKRASDASAKRVSGAHVVRKLWADAHGSFSTKGNYAAGAVQGTEWLTEDLCDGTLIKVTRDKVKVTDLVTHRSVEVLTGHHFFAKAP